VLELPNLEGQPGWVIIVVVALVAIGSIGVAYVRREAKRDDDDPQESPPLEGEPARVGLPAGANALDLVKDSMGVLATQAAAHKADADRAEEEARELARELASCARDKAVLEAQMAALAERHADLQRRYEACLGRTRDE
jgi:hypothetical protein